MTVIKIASIISGVSKTTCKCLPLAAQQGLGWSLHPVRKGFPREGEKDVNPGPPIFFWVDQKQSSYKVGKRKLKIYCSKNSG